MKQSLPIIKAGLIAGTLDIIVAFIHFFILTGSNPLSIFKYIASGLFGNAAFSGGTAMIFAGLVLHYLIAFAFTFLFFRVYHMLRLSTKNKFATGIVYGLVVWLVMNLLVLPMSRIPKRPFDPGNAMINLVILIACIGIPISLMAHRHFQSTKTGS